MELIYIICVIVKLQYFLIIIKVYTYETNSYIENHQKLYISSIFFLVEKHIFDARK